jgi:uncharacterized integral membrane protein
MFRRLIVTILLIAIALLALLFGALNAYPVEVELAFARFTLPLGVALVIALVLGLLAGIVWRIAWVAELLTERGRLRRALREAEARAAPVAPRADAGK